MAAFKGCLTIIGAIVVFIVVIELLGGGSGGCATAAGFAQLQIGDSYEQAASILGCAGQEVSRTQVGNTSMIIYSWDGKSGFGANMNATFENDSLINKTQLGLQN